MANLKNGDKTPTTICGKWTHLLNGEYAKVGQITMAVGPDRYLIRMRPHDKALPFSQLLTIDELCDHDDYHVAIFDTEKEMDAWVASMADDDGGDDGPRVVAMRKRKSDS